jgi:hypothetical protein
VDGMNLYQYVAGNPSKYIDATGTWSITYEHDALQPPDMNQWTTMNKLWAKHIYDTVKANNLVLRNTIRANFSDICCKKQAWIKELYPFEQMLIDMNGRFNDGNELLPLYIKPLQTSVGRAVFAPALEINNIVNFLYIDLDPEFFTNLSNAKRTLWHELTHVEGTEDSGINGWFMDPNNSDRAILDPSSLISALNLFSSLWNNKNTPNGMWIHGDTGNTGCSLAELYWPCDVPDRLQ